MEEKEEKQETTEEPKQTETKKEPKETEPKEPDFSEMAKKIDDLTNKIEKINEALTQKLSTRKTEIQEPEPKEEKSKEKEFSDDELEYISEQLNL